MSYICLVRRDHLVTDSLKEISAKQKDLKKKLKVQSNIIYLKKLNYYFNFKHYVYLWYLHYIMVFTFDIKKFLPVKFQRNIIVKNTLSFFD